MDQVLFGLGDVDEDAGEKLERVDEGLIVDLLSCLGLIEEHTLDKRAREAGRLREATASLAGPKSEGRIRRLHNRGSRRRRHPRRLSQKPYRRLNRSSHRRLRLSKWVSRS
jgi:hypothetical protein